MTPPVVEIVPAMQWHRVAAERIARYLVRKLSRGSSVRCTAALSGGNTPASVYEELADKYRTVIDWPRLDVFLSDERMVPHTHSESNQRLAWAHLFDRLPEPRPVFHPVATEMSVEQAAQKYEEDIRKVVTDRWQEFPEFDLILLGMGVDGHTASLFPKATELTKSDRLVTPARHPESGQARVSFSLPLIAAARQVIFLVTGSRKAEMVARVCRTDPVRDYPAGEVTAQARELLWILDDLAATGLT